MIIKMMHGCEAQIGHGLRVTKQPIKIRNEMSCAKEVEALPRISGMRWIFATKLRYSGA
jgi:hypothetical protein